MPPLMEVLFNHYGFSGACLILGGIALHFCVSAAFFRPLDLHQRILKSERYDQFLEHSLSVGIYQFYSIPPVVIYSM